MRPFFVSYDLGRTAKGANFKSVFAYARANDSPDEKNATPPVIASEGTAIVKEYALKCSEAISGSSLRTFSS